MALDWAKLTKEQQAEITKIAEIAGVDLQTLLAPAPRKANLGKLEGLLQDDGTYTCPCCGHVENYNNLDDVAKAKARKTGLCVSCQKIADFVSNNKTARVRVKNEISAGEMCRNAILPHIDQLSEEQMTLLTDINFCRKTFKLAYPLFLQLPKNCSKEDKNNLRKPDKKNARFATVEYTINSNKYIICNDLYLRNIAPIEQYFASIFPED